LFLCGASLLGAERRVPSAECELRWAEWWQEEGACGCASMSLRLGHGLSLVLLLPLGGEGPRSLLQAEEARVFTGLVGWPAEQSTSTKIHVQKRPTSRPSSSNVLSAHAVARTGETTSHYAPTPPREIATFKSNTDTHTHTHTHSVFIQLPQNSYDCLANATRQHDHHPTHYFHTRRPTTPESRPHLTDFSGGEMRRTGRLDGDRRGRASLEPWKCCSLIAVTACAHSNSAATTPSRLVTTLMPGLLCSVHHYLPSSLLATGIRRGGVGWDHDEEDCGDGGTTSYPPILLL
jgi:hypothetical protein